MYYVIGVVILLVIVGVGFFLRPKPPAPQSLGQQTGQAVYNVPTPTPGPITDLACDTAYYNPVIGYEKYYLSADGGDLSATESIECTFNATVDDKVVASEKVKADLAESPARGGKTFRCTTKGLELKANVPTVVDVMLKNNAGKSATCSATFLFPAP